MVGADGADGPTGAAGPTGATGAAGQDGVDGIVHSPQTYTYQGLMDLMREVSS
jgi:hypothetical protein